MPFEIWISFVAASAILLVIPGPTILTIISYSVSQGKQARLPLVLAVALGDSTALVLSLLGLGALLATSAFWFTAVKWVGGLYLLYLGISLLRSGISTPTFDNAPTSKSRLKLFTNTWLVTALNPKGIIFFVAFLPQFINQGQAITPQLWLLSITFVLLATVNASLYVLFAGQARKMLSSPRNQKRFNLTGGSLLCTAGLWALTARQA